MSQATTAASAPAVDSDQRSDRVDGAVDHSGGSRAALGTLARVVQAIVGIIVLILVAGIVFVLFKANPANSIVSDIHNAARWLAGPFDGIFSLHNVQDTVAINWGLAAVVYAAIGVLIAHLLISRD